MTDAGRLAARLRAYVRAQARRVPAAPAALASAIEGPAWDRVYAEDVIDACAPREHGRPASDNAEVRSFAIHALLCPRRAEDAACWECTRSEVRARYVLGVAD